MSDEMTACESCGSPMRATAKFCPSCGAPRAGVVENIAQMPAAGADDAGDPMENFSFPVGDSSTDRPAEPDYGLPLSGAPASPQELPPFDSPSNEIPLPTASTADIFDAAPVASGAERGKPLGGRLPLVIGCCAALAILGCVLVLVTGGSVLRWLGLM